jgi:hypothetical protein
MLDYSTMSLISLLVHDLCDLFIEIPIETDSLKKGRHGFLFHIVFIYSDFGS